VGGAPADEPASEARIYETAGTGQNPILGRHARSTPRRLRQIRHQRLRRWQRLRTAARTPDGRLAIIYAPMIRPLRIDAPERARHCAVVRPGQRRLQRDRRVAVRQHGFPEFHAPGNNHDGNGDWVRVLEVI